MKAIVNYWRFDDGNKPINPGNPFGEICVPRGWYCWVYPENDEEFADWMSRMCPTAEVTHRFNSGDPMWTVYIHDDTEVTLFQLRWL